MHEYAEMMRDAILNGITETCLDLDEFCERCGIRKCDFDDFMAFGTQAYSDYLQQMEEGDINGL